MIGFSSRLLRGDLVLLQKLQVFSDKGPTEDVSIFPHQVSASCPVRAVKHSMALKINILIYELS